MVKRYGCAGILLLAMGLLPLRAQDNAVAKEMAIKIQETYRTPHNGTRKENPLIT